MSVSAGVYGVVAAQAAAAGFGLTGTPETASSIDEDGFNVTANLYVDNDGSLRKRTESLGSFTTVEFGTYNSGAGDDAGFGDAFHVRVSYSSGSNNYQSGSGLGTWLALTSDRSWQFQVADSGPSVSTGVFLVEFSDDGGSTVLDSFNFTSQLQNQSP